MVNKNQFEMKSIADLSWKNCYKYINLFFPFIEINKIFSIKGEYIDEHISILNKFVKSQEKINKFIESWRESISLVNKEVSEFVESNKEKPSNSIKALKRTDPSLKLKDDFIENVEFLAMRMQDVARICLKIIWKDDEIIQSNLVIVYEKWLRDTYWEDSQVLEKIDLDNEWIILLKELRSETWRHSEWDKNKTRKLNFHPMKIDLKNDKKPTIIWPWFTFESNKWELKIWDFEEFYETLINNIFTVTIDRLVFAYAYNGNIKFRLLHSTVKWKWQKDK